MVGMMFLQLLVPLRTVPSRGAQWKEVVLPLVEPNQPVALRLLRVVAVPLHVVLERIVVDEISLDAVVEPTHVLQL